MIRLTFLFAVALVLGGCTSLRDPLPKCDGYSRRPLNRAMWQWDGNSNPQLQKSDAELSPVMTPYINLPEHQEAFAHLDIDGSPRPCVE